MRCKPGGEILGVDVKLIVLCYMLRCKLRSNDNAVRSRPCVKVMPVSASRARLFNSTYPFNLELVAVSYYVLEYSSSPLISLVSQSSKFQHLRQIYLWECFQVRSRGYCSHPASRTMRRGSGLEAFLLTPLMLSVQRRPCNLCPD